MLQTKIARSAHEVFALFDRERERCRLNPEWKVHLNPRLKSTLGICRHGCKEITLSRRYALHASEADLVDTILHEIAHALLPAGMGHGAEWRMTCKIVGARPEQYATLEKAKAGFTGFMLKCSSCGTELGLKSRPPKPARTYRSRCCRGVVEWVRLA